jgi:hypothetical protein
MNYPDLAPWTEGRFAERFCFNGRDRLVAHRRLGILSMPPTSALAEASRNLRSSSGDENFAHFEVAFLVRRIF